VAFIVYLFYFAATGAGVYENETKEEQENLVLCTYFMVNEVWITLTNFSIFLLK
jgi:hypothetical protein